MPLPAPTTPFFDVVVLGGGFSGAATAIQLLQPSETFEETLRIALVDADGSFGPGIAYGKGAGEGLLNVGAAVMGAFPDAPGDFLRWAQERAANTGTAIPAPSAFVQRKVYGLYLKECLRKAVRESPHVLETLQARAVDLVPLPDGTLSVSLEGGRFLYAGKVVLAVGNFPPAPPSESKEGGCRGHAGYLDQPWEEDVVEKLAAPGDILILGTGLTCLDYLTALDARKKEGTIHVLSRRGLFPLPHPPASVPFKNEGPIDPAPLREMVRAVREKIAAGAFWRDVIDSLRPQSQTLWRQLSLADKRRFLRHLRPYWDTARHRAPAETLAVKDRLEKEGRVVCHKGRIVSLTPRGDGIEVVFRKRGAEGMTTLRVARVANGTGLATDCLRTGDPLVKNLLDRGLAKADALGIGFEADAQGRISPPGAPEVFALGSLRRGSLWETTAVRELRQQAADIAARIRGEEAAAPLHACAEAALLFDI